MPAGADAPLCPLHPPPTLTPRRSDSFASHRRRPGGQSSYGASVMVSTAPARREKVPSPPLRGFRQPLFQWACPFRPAGALQLPVETERPRGEGAGRRGGKKIKRKTFCLPCHPFQATGLPPRPRPPQSGRAGPAHGQPSGVHLRPRPGDPLLQFRQRSLPRPSTHSVIFSWLPPPAVTCATSDRAITRSSGGALSSLGLFASSPSQAEGACGLSPTSYPGPALPPATHSPRDPAHVGACWVSVSGYGPSRTTGRDFQLSCGFLYSDGLWAPPGKRAQFQTHALCAKSTSHPKTGT